MIAALAGLEAREHRDGFPRVPGFKAFQQSRRAVDLQPIHKSGAIRSFVQSGRTPPQAPSPCAGLSVLCGFLAATLQGSKPT